MNKKIEFTALEALKNFSDEPDIDDFNISKIDIK